MEQIFHSRKISGELIGYIQVLPTNDTVTIYRVGDKLSDKLTIPKAIIKEKILETYDVCTLPEFEILYILNDGLYDDYLKNKSIKRADVYYKEKNNNYSKRSSFVYEYFKLMSNEEIIELIKLYVQKRGGTHKKTQLSLSDIMK